MKSIFKSKIFWTQVISAILGIFAVITPDFLQGLGFTPDNTAKILTVIGALNTILTILFRLTTNKGVIFNPGKDKTTNKNG